jgi:hypothetical protein
VSTQILDADSPAKQVLLDFFLQIEAGVVGAFSRQLSAGS